ncbi:MAG: alpha/beta hydrolase [Deltaproteobacteria bacterium]|nr:alpha/beta hydrolase [Deltaproteobacteria bacterium]
MSAKYSITKLLLIVFLIGCFIVLSLFFWSSYRIDSRERYTGQQLAIDGAFIKVGGVNTHLIRKGKGKPLILIHGIFSSSFVWHKNIDALAEHFDVIALDLKGYGYSDKPADGRYGREDFRQFVLDFMDAIKVNKAVLVGHSWGGGIAMDLALQHPERVEKLVLINSTGYPPEPSFVEWLLRVPGVGRLILAACDKGTFARILKERVFFDPELVTEEEVEGWMRPYYVRGAAQAALELRNYHFDMAEEIRNISQPTLIIWGKEDKALPAEVAERFRQDIKNSVLQIIPNCGHNPQEEKPEEVNGLIKWFAGN